MNEMWPKDGKKMYESWNERVPKNHPFLYAMIVIVSILVAVIIAKSYI